jgi:hypothetical protein
LRFAFTAEVRHDSLGGVGLLGVEVRQLQEQQKRGAFEPEAFEGSWNILL